MITCRHEAKLRGGLLFLKPYHIFEAERRHQIWLTFLLKFTLQPLAAKQNA